MRAALVTPFLKHLPLHPGVFLGVGAAVLERRLDLEIIDLNADVHDDRATIELLVSGPNEPQPVWALAQQIQLRFDGPVDLDLQYQRDDLFQVSVR